MRVPIATLGPREVNLYTSVSSFNENPTQCSEHRKRGLHLFSVCVSVYVWSTEVLGVSVSYVFYTTTVGVAPDLYGRINSERPSTCPTDLLPVLTSPLTPPSPVLPGTDSTPGPQKLG